MFGKGLGSLRCESAGAAGAGFGAARTAEAAEAAMRRRDFILEWDMNLMWYTVSRMNEYSG